MNVSQEDLDAMLQHAYAEGRKDEAEEAAGYRADAMRYRWLRDSKGLTLESYLSTWTRIDGSKFTSHFRLAAYNIQFAPHETLDEAVDSAIRITP